MLYRKCIIYYFTGTGNSKNVALWFSRVASENGTDCEIINIAQIDRVQMGNPDPEALLVFVSPIHGFNYPPVMLHFIFRFPKGRNDVILMNTRAGMLIGKFITPGLTGIAFYFSMLILKIKKYSIKAICPVDLPSNWISVHPGLNRKTVTFIHKKIKERVKKFSLKVISGKTHFRALWEMQDILISPVSVLYYFIGRFFFAKTYYASADCNNCDVCVKGCPVKAILKVNNRPFWTFNCESCMKCMSNCPSKAIETGHGFIAAYALIFYTILIGLFYQFLDRFSFKVESGLLRMIAESALFLFVLVLWYRIIHFLMGFRFFERIVVYTSLTKYKFWGRRYKAIKDP